MSRCYYTLVIIHFLFLFLFLFLKKILFNICKLFIVIQPFSYAIYIYNYVVKNQRITIDSL